MLKISFYNLAYFYEKPVFITILQQYTCPFLSKKWKDSDLKILNYSL